MIAIPSGSRSGRRHQMTVLSHDHGGRTIGEYLDEQSVHAGESAVGRRRRITPKRGV